MNAQVAAYTPSLYLPGGYGRYRTYPRVVRTPIPGAGFRNVGNLIWGEQLINLDGARGPLRFGTYPSVPLLGLAGDMIDLRNPMLVGLGLVVIAEFARRASARSAEPVAPNGRRRKRRRRAG